jgi:hypothetical protein
MVDKNITLEDIRMAYERWAGSPSAVIELRRNEQNERVPTELDILFFQPTVEDHLSEEDYFTYIATVGMSTRVMQAPCLYAELIISVQKKQSPKAIEMLARRLAELAVLPFRASSYFAPNFLFYDISLPLFDRMNCVLITDWGVSSPEYLPGIQPPVRLLSVKPVYESEAKVIAVIGAIEACRRFRYEEINWDDPQRDPADLKEVTR